MERGSTSPNLTKGTLALALSRYCQFASSKDAELSFQLANQLYLLMEKTNSSLVTVKNYTALLKNALSADANKQADVFTLIKNSTALTRCVRRESSVEFIGCYMELLDACAQQHMPSSELLDLLERPLEQGYDHNIGSVISYFKDTKLLTAYASLLKQCADTDANKARVSALLVKKIEGYTLFNIGGGRTLGELLKQHNLSVLSSLVKPEIVEPVLSPGKNEMELTAFNTQSIMQSTSSAPALEPVFIDLKTWKIIHSEPEQTKIPPINPRGQTLFKTPPQKTNVQTKKDPTATEIYAELEALPPPPNTRPVYHRPATPAEKLGVKI